ncbi:hypothetical protein PanWU01x14_200370 [Parasponia andersonii]|uniref:Uncharacterized protein n=1 Tax=Parasponia andersonii TaxID=3476 RepID=A0A2P5BY44_PARAD|nr:hypothetical protein PanWU01x14_200370 [Parasponia andersonii]
MREIYFDIGGKRVRFGLCEFALTMELNFGKYPDEAKSKDMSGSRRLVEKYMNDSKVVKSGELETTFLNCGDIEDGHESFLKTMAGLKKDLDYYYYSSFEAPDRGEGIHGSILTFIHGPKVSHGTDESVSDLDELDANEKY